MRTEVQPSDYDGMQAKIASCEYYNNKLPYTDRRIDREAYRQEDRRIEQQFRIDLENAYGIRVETGSPNFQILRHPLADRLWAKAWEHGHANGFNEVLYWYDELVELVDRNPTLLVAE